MKYFIPIILSLPVLIFPFLGNKSISWEIVFLVIGYLWIGVAIGETIGKNKN